MNHAGKVTCRGMLLEGKVYRTGDTLTPQHKDMVMFLFRDVIDTMTSNGWLAIHGGSLHFVTFASIKPDFLQ